MLHHGHNSLHRDRHGRPVRTSCSLRQSPETIQAFAQAVRHVDRCLSEGRLLNSHEAMALACGEAREKETLYSIARLFAQDDRVDQADLLCELERKFPEFV
jgi:hypothetical protein